MADDLLNSLLNNMDDDEQGEGLGSLLNSMDESPAADAGGGDLLGSLLNAMGDAPSQPEPSGDDMMGGLSGLAGLLGGGGAGGGGGMAGMLGALLGGGSSASSSSPMGGLMGGGGGADLSQMPIVGSIINSLADKFGIPPAQASALVMAAISMLMSKKGRSGVDRVEELDLSGLLNEAPQHSDLIAQAAQEAGLDEEQAATGMQDALQMLMNALQE